MSRPKPVIEKLLDAGRRLRALKAENAALRAELAQAKQDFENTWMEVVARGKELTAALDRLEALEKVADEALRLCSLPEHAWEQEDYESHQKISAEFSRLSTSGSTVDKKGTGSKPIPHTTPGTKYGSGRPE